MRDGFTLWQRLSFAGREPKISTENYFVRKGAPGFQKQCLVEILCVVNFIGFNNFKWFDVYSTECDSHLDM